MFQHDAHVFDYVLDWIETERKLEILAEGLGMKKEDVIVFIGPFGCDPQDGMVGMWDE